MNCEGCGSTCQALMSDHHPRASEWYCGKCHKSHLMCDEDIQQMRMMRNQQPRGPGGPDALRSP